jgi:origin recognition complex subunit 2
MGRKSTSQTSSPKKSRSKTEKIEKNENPDSPKKRGRTKKLSSQTENEQTKDMISKPDHEEDEWTSSEDDLFYENESEDDEISSKDDQQTTSKLAKSLQKRDYFLKKSEKIQTSNNTLAGLGSILDRKQILSILDKVPQKHLKDKEEQMKRMENEFTKWFFELHHGFNLLIFGAGSKRKLLEKFAETMLDNQLCLVVQGYLPTLQIRTILTTITSNIFQYEDTPTNEKLLRLIEEGFAHPERYEETIPAALYILIHNIDGPALRNLKAQTILSQLAAIPQIHFVASVDHINACQLWDASMKTKLNWVWHEVHTYDRYVEETKYDQTLLGSSSGSSSEIVGMSLRFVLRSLTPNAREIFRVLAQHQLDNANAQEHGLSYRQFYEKCREKFLVTSEETMRSQLTEFRDHNVIITKKSGKSGGNFFIPVIPAIIKQTLEDPALFPQTRM